MLKPAGTRRRQTAAGCGIAYHMNDAGLNDRLRKNGVDRLGASLTARLEIGRAESWSTGELVTRLRLIGEKVDQRGGQNHLPENIAIGARLPDRQTPVEGSSNRRGATRAGFPLQELVKRSGIFGHSKRLAGEDAATSL